MLELVNLSSITLAQAGQSGGQMQKIFANIFPIILLIGVMYLLLIRPQQKKAKEHQQLTESLKAGDQILTSGGLYGTISGVKENMITLKVAEGVEIDLARNSVRERVNSQQAENGESSDTDAASSS